MKLHRGVFEQYDIGKVSGSGKEVTFHFNDWDGYVAFETMLNEQSTAQCPACRGEGGGGDMENGGMCDVCNGTGRIEDADVTLGKEGLS